MPEPFPPHAALDKSAGLPRLASLDVFRGLTILAMLLVNNAGDWNHVYWPMGHSKWHGWTPCDLIFPFFLFIVGTAIAYALRKYRSADHVAPEVYVRIGRRVLIMFLLGMLLNAAGPLLEQLLFNRSGFTLATVRIPGVLQRIAVVYGLASLIVLHCGLRAQMAVGGTLLLGYWALVAALPDRGNYQKNLSPEGSVIRAVDVAMLGEAHMYRGAVAANEPDPEGILSTFPAVATTLFGYWIGLFIQRRPANLGTIFRLAAIGLTLCFAGLAWDVVLPINKKIWTSSYVVFAAGLGTVGLAICLWLFDVLGFRRAARPFEVVGVNAIFVFVASGVVGRLLSLAPEGSIAPKAWIYENLFAGPLGGSSELSSLLYGAVTAIIWWFVLWLMSLRKWAIRI